MFTISRSGSWVAFVFFWKCESSTRCPGTSFLRWDIIAPVFILLIIITLTSRQCVICPWYSWKCSPSIQIGCPLWQSDGHFSNVFEIQSTRARDYIPMNSLDDSLWWYIKLYLWYWGCKNGIFKSYMVVVKEASCCLQDWHIYWHHTFRVAVMSTGVWLLIKGVLT